MKLIFLLLFLLLQKIILKEEGKTKNETKEELLESYDEERGYFPGDKIYDLNDLLFDHIIRDGKIYRWFIIFYSKTCGHCRNAKREISKVYEIYKNNKTLRFAQIEAYDNSLTNVRFNITGVPYMILVENNTMYELDLFPNFDNLKNFVNTNFSEVKDELKLLPIKVKFHYVAWVIFRQTLESITDSFNHLLNRKGIKIKFNPYVFIISVFLTIIICCTAMVKCCIYCCCNDEDIARELKMLEEQYNLELERQKKEKRERQSQGQGTVEKENEEGENGEEEDEEEEEEDDEYEEEEDDEGEEEEDDEKKKENSEEKKKEIEQKKEEEKKRLEEEKRKKEEEEKRKKEEEKIKNEKKTKKKKKNKNE